MAIIYQALNQVSDSEEQFKIAIDKDYERFKGAKHDWQKVSALISTAETLYEKKDLSAALETLKRAKAFAKNNQRKMAYIEHAIERIQGEQSQ